MTGGVDFPQLFDTDAVALRILACVKLEARDDLLAQMATCTFCKHSVLGVQFHAQLEVFGGLAIFANAHVAGSHTFDGAVVVVQNFCGCKAWKNFNAQSLSLLPKPAREISQADDVVAIVVKARWQGEIGHASGARFGGHQENIFGDGLIQRGAHFFPFWKEFC